MAKRLTQPSLKIFKKQQPTHQFNSLIKVLKPKVFITTSSKFKTLVQELTGNGSHPPATSEPAHVIQIDDHDSPDPSLTCSSDDRSLENIFVPFDYSYCSSEELQFQLSQDRVMDYVNELDQLKNLESWLLDFDPSACFQDVPFVPMSTF